MDIPSFVNVLGFYLLRQTRIRESAADLVAPPAKRALDSRTAATQLTHHLPNAGTIEFFALSGIAIVKLSCVRVD
jgi:hypothetical protein